MLALTLSVIVVGQTLRPEPASGDATADIVGDLPNNISGKAGEQIGSFQIPTIDLDQPLYEGTNAATLKNGPGHYRTTPLPGKSGNVAIACHRTTFGAPCFRLGELKKGDEIRISRKRISGGDVWFTYRVTQTLVVKPSQNDVLRAVPYVDTLTITTCHPLYSDKQRLIIQAELV